MAKLVFAHFLVSFLYVLSIAMADWKPKEAHEAFNPNESKCHIKLSKDRCNAMKKRNGTLVDTGECTRFDWEGEHFS